MSIMNLTWKKKISGVNLIGVDENRMSQMTATKTSHSDSPFQKQIIRNPPSEN